jgi:hypothetical protein
MATQAQTNNRNRNRGKNFERKCAEILGFFRVPYSGSSKLWGLGDIRDNEHKNLSRYMGECKTMTPKSKTEVNYIIQAKWLIGPDSVIAKAKKENNKFPFLAFTKKASPLTFIITRIEDFKMLIDALDILRAKGLISDTLDVDKTREEINNLKSQI